MLLQIRKTVEHQTALITWMPFPGHTMTLRLHVNIQTVFIFKGRIALLTSEPNTLMLHRNMITQQSLVGRLIAALVAKELDLVVLCVKMIL